MTASFPNTPYGGPSDRQPVEDHGCVGFVTIPLSNATALFKPVRGIVITADGDLQLVMPDGSSNSTVIAVTAGPTVYPYACVQLGASNTAGVLGVV
jgi:hypothetical protein